MSDALQSARAKLARRKGQPAADREPYTREEFDAMMAYATSAVRKQLGTRAQRRAANKAAWAAGDRSRWHG